MPILPDGTWTPYPTDSKVYQDAVAQQQAAKQKADQAAAAQKQADALATSRREYVGDRKQLISQKGWDQADKGLIKQGYRDPRVAIQDPWVQQGMTPWGDKERQGVMSRTQAARGRQIGALNLLSQQAGETPAADRMAAYKLGQAGNAATGAIGAGGTAAAGRAAMLGLGKQASTISGQSMGQASDERMRAISSAAQAADKALGGYTSAAGEGQRYQALSLQDKWNRQKALTDYEKQRLATEMARTKAKGAISKQDMDFYMGLLGASSSALASGASALGNYGSSSSGQGGTSGYDSSQPSDREVKLGTTEGEQPLTEMVGKLRPYSYTYDREQVPEAPAGRQVGVMAQDLEKSPLGRSYVAEDEQGIKRVDYGRMLPALLGALASQQRRIEDLEGEE